MSNKSNLSLFYLLAGGAIIVYYVFFFDYKRFDFNWIHSIIAFVGIGLVLSGTEKSRED